MKPAQHRSALRRRRDNLRPLHMLKLLQTLSFSIRSAILPLLKKIESLEFGQIARSTQITPIFLIFYRVQSRSLHLSPHPLEHPQVLLQIGASLKSFQPNGLSSSSRRVALEGKSRRIAAFGHEYLARERIALFFASGRFPAFILRNRRVGMGFFRDVRDMPSHALQFAEPRRNCNGLTRRLENQRL